MLPESTFTVNRTQEMIHWPRIFSMNTFGHLFRITTFGESHGSAMGVVVDGCPPGLALSLKDFDADVARRKTAQSSITSSRKEEDQVEILSGVFEGKTLGSPITLMVKNTGARPEDYEMLKKAYRPSHADFTYEEKYNVFSWQGGGRASARETVARVLAGVVAKKLLKESCDMECIAYVKQVGDIQALVNPLQVRLSQVEKNSVRCPDERAAEKMLELIKKVQREGDTIGGVVECVIRHIPPGLGDPVFDKLKATLAYAMMSLPAAVAFEIGSGCTSLGMKGSEHNDAFRIKKNTVVTTSNHSGGIQGGISNGMPIIFRTVFKPVSTIFKAQKTVTRSLKNTTLTMHGRHDPCVVPRAVVIVEAMAGIVLADHYLRQKTLAR